MKNPSLFAVAFLAAGLVASTAYAKVSTDDFAQKAGIGGQFEITSSRLALTNSQNDSVKNLAQELLDDHKKIGDQMNSILQLTAPDKVQANPALDSSHQKMVDQLSEARGHDFDKMFVDDQAKAHKEAIGLFKKYAKDGDNDQLKSFAQQTLPMLQKHQDDVKQLQKSM